MEKIISESLNNLLLSLVHQGYKTPLEFAVKDIDFALDIGADEKKYIPEQTPYLTDVLKSWNFTNHIREITICAPERTGKTLAWMMPLAWSMIHHAGRSLVMYQTDNMCRIVNDTKLLPLLNAIPSIKEQLARPKSKIVDYYELDENTLFLTSSGADITSIESKIVILDELDKFQSVNGSVSNLEHAKKRVGSYKKESLICKVCTPEKDTGAIWSEFKKSSQGYWHLRCLNCHELSIKSCDIKHLKFSFNLNADEQKILDRSKPIYLECPICQHKHYEKDRFAMNLQGGYIHEVPELIDTNVGYQWGALASCLPRYSFEKIAEMQLLAGSSGSYENRQIFANTYRGLPIITKDTDKQYDERIKDHIPTHFPKVEDIESIMVAIDTQDEVWKWTMHGLDTNSNRWLLNYGACEYLSLTPNERTAIDEAEKVIAAREGRKFNPVSTIEDVIYSKWQGMEVLLGLIDTGGHKSLEVHEFAAKHVKLRTYKGDRLTGQNSQARYKESDNNQFPKLIIGNSNVLQVELLYELYQRKKSDKKYFWFCPDVGEIFIKEILAMQPARDDKDRVKYQGYQYENWCKYKQRADDYFDCCKMYLMLEAWAINRLPAKYFKHNKASILNRKNTVNESAETATEDKPLPVIRKSFIRWQ